MVNLPFLHQLLAIFSLQYLYIYKYDVTMCLCRINIYCHGNRCSVVDIFTTHCPFCDLLSTDKIFVDQGHIIVSHCNIIFLRLNSLFVCFMIVRLAFSFSYFFSLFIRFNSHIRCDYYTHHCFFQLPYFIFISLFIVFFLYLKHSVVVCHSVCVLLLLMCFFYFK